MRGTATGGAAGGDTTTQMANAGIWGLSGRVVLLVANLLSNPFTIRLLGPARYGLWGLVNTTVSWASTADLGLGPASTKLGADYYAADDAGSEAAVVWSSLAVISVSTITVAVALALAAPTILHALLDMPRSLVGPGVLALRIGCGVFVLMAVAGIVDTPALVRLRWRPYSLINTFANLFAIVGTPIALFAISRGVVTAATLALATASLLMVGNFFLAVHFQPAIRRPHFERQITRKLLSYGGALTLAGLSSIPLLTAERYFLAANHSTVVVAYYAVAISLATTLQVLPEQLTGPLLPSLARLRAAGLTAEFTGLYSKALAGLFMLLTPVSILLAFVAAPFFTLWAGPAYGAQSTTPFFIAIGGIWVGSFAMVPYSCLLATGHTRVIAIVQMSEVPFYLVAAWQLTSHFGAVGAAIAWASRFTVDAAIIFFLVRHFEGLSLTLLPARRVKAVLAPALLALACYALTRTSGTFVPRAAEAIVLAATYAATAWRLVLDPAERAGIIRMVPASLLQRTVQLHTKP